MGGVELWQKSQTNEKEPGEGTPSKETAREGIRDSLSKTVRERKREEFVGTLQDREGKLMVKHMSSGRDGGKKKEEEGRKGRRKRGSKGWSWWKWCEEGSKQHIEMKKRREKW